MSIKKKIFTGSSGNMKCLTFHRITPLGLFDGANVTLKKLISQFIADGLNGGFVQPLPYSIFSDKNATDIFR